MVKRVANRGNSKCSAPFISTASFNLPQNFVSLPHFTDKEAEARKIKEFTEWGFEPSALKFAKPGLCPALLPCRLLPPAP